MNKVQNSTSVGAPRRQWNGLALFAGGMAILVVVIALGANFLFNRMHSTGPGLSAGPDEVKPVQTTPHATVSEPQTPPDAASDRATAVDKAGAAAPQAHDGAAAANAAAVQPTTSALTAFTPPAESSFPEGEYGKVVRLGEQIFLNTGKHAAPYVGNDLSCGNCHLDAGRKADSAPMWASFIRYPAFRGKTGKVDTLAARIQGCFIYSMNGKAPPQDDEVMTALQTYFFWLAKGAPVGTPIQGSGYPELAPPAMAADRSRGGGGLC